MLKTKRRAANKQTTKSNMFKYFQAALSALHELARLLAGF